MRNRVIVKEGDTLPAARVRVARGDGQPADLSAATALEFRLTPAADGLRGDFTTAARLPLEDASVIENVWAAGDTAIPGLYRGEFRALYTGGWKTIPTDGYVYVEVAAAARSRLVSVGLSDTGVAVS